MKCLYYQSRNIQLGNQEPQEIRSVFHDVVTEFENIKQTT